MWSLRRSFFGAEILPTFTRLFFGNNFLRAIFGLKIKFCNELHETRCRSTDDCPEVRVFDLAVYGCGAVELSVVEGVEGLDAELERSGFGET